MPTLRRTSKFLVYLLAPALGLISPILVLPAITSNYGAGGWTAIAIGQSVGAGASVLVELGWSLTGSQQVSCASKNQQTTILIESTASRMLVLAATAPASFLTAASISQFYPSVAGLNAIASSAGAGLSVAWYYMGSDAPWRLVLIDAGPRLAASAAIFGGLTAGGSLWLVPTFTLISPFVSLLLAGIDSGATKVRVRSIGFRYTTLVIRRQAWAVSGRIASATYLSLAVALVGIFSPASTAGFAAIDRVQRTLLVGLQALPNSMQAYVGRALGFEVRRRLSGSIAANALVGLVCATLMYFAGSSIIHYLFSGTVQVSKTELLLSGIIILLTCTSRATGGLALVRLGAVRVITFSAWCAAVVALCGIYFGATRAGIAGALGGMVAAEMVALAIQLLGLHNLSVKRRLHTACQRRRGCS